MMETPTAPKPRAWYFKEQIIGQRNPRLNIRKPSLQYFNKARIFRFKLYAVAALLVYKTTLL
jgi:hypothetical protein